MDEECEGNNSFDFPFPEDGGHMYSNTSVPPAGQTIPQDVLRENEESSGTNDYPEGIEGFTPPKNYRIHKLVKAKTDRKTTKKTMHRSHSSSKIAKKEQRPVKSKSMIELPTSPDVNVLTRKHRHFSIPAVITTDQGIAVVSNEEETPVILQPHPSPGVNKLDNIKESFPPEEPQPRVKSPDPRTKHHMSSNMKSHSTSSPWQKYPYRRRSSVDANSISIVSRTSSSPSSSQRLFDSLYEPSGRVKPRTSLNLLSLHVDQDDRLDYGVPNRMKSSSLSQHRHTSSFVPECPRERNEFYSHLHMTVLHLGIAGAVARRQADTEETKDSIHQSISLQLRAYLQKRSVRAVSDDLAMRKLDVAKSIEDILFFSLPLGDEGVSKQLFRPFSVRAMYTEISTDSNDGESLETINEEDDSTEPQSTDNASKEHKKETTFHNDQFMTSAQAGAMEKVKEVLDALDEAESLYQSLAEVGDEHPKYRSNEFVRKVEALQLWVRITETLASKLCQLSRLCGIRVDLEPGEDDVCLQSLNSSRILWNNMDMDQTRTSCCERKYRDFVDQHLKKYGVEKMMRMVTNSLANALSIAR